MHILHASQYKKEPLICITLVPQSYQGEDLMASLLLSSSACYYTSIVHLNQQQSHAISPLRLPSSSSLSSLHNHNHPQNSLFSKNSSLFTGHLGYVPPHCVTSSPVLTPLSDLYDFICRGPILLKTGDTPQTVASSLDEWLRLGINLSRQLGFNELFLSEEQKIRIYHYYIPVYLWCQAQLARHQAQFQEGQPLPPLVIGVSAPQGSGKTTLVYCLDYLFNSIGRKAISISIDDFYLTAKDQVELAAQFAGNDLLQLRGNAGTHDLSLGTETLKALCSLTTEGKSVKVPRYDKSLHNGRGDRADPSTWPEVEGPLEVVLFEGWMLGFQPLEAEAVKAVDNQLEAVNRHLASYYEAWDKYVNSWLILQVGDPNWVYKWRLQAEIAMRADGKPGMTNEQVADFVSRYIPAYQAYLPGLYSKGPRNATSECMLQFEVDEDRNPIA